MYMQLSHSFVYIFFGARKFVFVPSDRVHVRVFLSFFFLKREREIVERIKYKNTSIIITGI